MYTEITNAAAENECPEGKGQLPGRCAAMAFPFVAMQGQDPKRYDQREALQQGTLFPGLDLPFHKELKSRFPAANTALSELMALDFAIDELGLYLVLTKCRNPQSVSSAVHFIQVIPKHLRCWPSTGSISG